MSQSHSGNTIDYKIAVREAVLDENTFVRLTLSGSVKKDSIPWKKVVVRPVVLKDGRQIQFSYFDDKKDITRNFEHNEASENLDELLSLPFQHINAQLTSGDIHIRITRKGKALISRGKPSNANTSDANFSHDRVKQRPLPANESNEFLNAIGITDKSGRVRPSMRAKFRQINEFIRLLEQVMPIDELANKSIEFVDCGCGNAYLTFAAYHYINKVKGLSAKVVGIDTNEEIIDRCRRLSDSLGWDRLDFRVSQIVDFQPSTPPDIVLSLHACDTATDEAIAQGILWNSKVIVAAPCCQHELNDHIQARSLQPILRHGILKQRTADIVTDAFRALVLRIMGYRTDVVQFVSPEHTSKNLMIRAVTGLTPGDKAQVQEYGELKEFWNVSPHIEKLLGERLTQYLEYEAESIK